VVYTKISAAYFLYRSPPEAIDVVEHIGPNVAVVTTSISLAAFSNPSLSTISIISSAVTTTASLFLIDLFVCF